MRTLSSRDRRALFFAAVVVAPVFAVAYGARPMMRSVGERVERTHQQRELLQRELGLIAGRSAVDSLQHVVDRSMADELKLVIHSGDRATAYSLLSERVRALARRRQVAVLQLAESPPDSIERGLTVLRMGLRAESDIAGVLGFLAAVESDPSRLRVTRLFIERANVRPLGEESGATDGRHVLMLTATIEALAWMAPNQAKGSR